MLKFLVPVADAPPESPRGAGVPRSCAFARGAGEAGRKMIKDHFAVSPRVPALSADALPTRGEEVDRAARAPPLRLLEEGLPSEGFEWFRRFSLDENGRAAGWGDSALDGVFLGLANRRSLSRGTLLTPRNVNIAAFETSTRLCAWVVLDSPEARYAVRAEPRQGRALEVDVDALVGWLRGRLQGAPPHKIPRKEYVAHLRALGLEVVMGAAVAEDVRFDLPDITTTAEREQAIRELHALGQADFDTLDWTEFDRAAGALACSSAVEITGDVTLDVAARRVLVPKVRPGIAWAASGFLRSFVTFHTHPSVRYEGGRSEPPSGGDLGHVLSMASHGLAWHFVAAPEGTYIFRPSTYLLAAYRRGGEETLKNAVAIYEQLVRGCMGAASACMATALAALRDAGFVAYGREAPCRALSSRPDMWAEWNRLGREEYTAEVARLAALAPAELLRADWTALFASAAAPSISAPTWMRAALHEGKVVRAGSAHHLADLEHPEEYPHGVPGPLMVFCVPDPAAFPEGVPHAAVEAARANARAWAWCAFVGPGRVLLFRATSSGVEVHSARDPEDARGSEPKDKPARASKKANTPPASGGRSEESPLDDGTPCATVGGVDYAVGGWGAYEIDRRRARWEAARAAQSRRVVGGAEIAERPGRRYPGLRVVSAQDAVRSVLEAARVAPGGGGADALRGALPRAAARLADELARLEDRLCDPSGDGIWECAALRTLQPGAGRALRAAAGKAAGFTVPPLTSADLRAFARDPDALSDPDSLGEMGAAVVATAASLGAPLTPLRSLHGGLPPLPPQAVPVAADEEILRLEAEVAPRVEALEALQAALATHMEAAGRAAARAAGRAPLA